jgi:TPR repeat protein
VGILRAAEARGNSRALVKLGAIYATGNCVPKDNAIAYHYFTRAHAVDPKNEWVEENRAILWANMTEDERARVRTEDGSIE